MGDVVRSRDVRRVGGVTAGEDSAERDAVLVSELVVLASGLDIVEGLQQRTVGIGGGAAAEAVGGRRDVDGGLGGVQVGEVDACQKLRSDVVAGGGTVVGFGDELEQRRPVPRPIGSRRRRSRPWPAGLPARSPRRRLCASVACLAADLVERAASNAQGHGGEQGKDDAEDGHLPQRAVGPGMADERAACGRRSTPSRSAVTWWLPVPRKPTVSHVSSIVRSSARTNTRLLHRVIFVAELRPDTDPVGVQTVADERPATGEA